MFFVVLAFCLAPFFAAAEAADPKPFTTDLCTGYPNGTRKEPNLWASCCLRHDLEYWAGGTSNERLVVDRALRGCVKATGARVQSEIMWLGVRIGELSPYKLPGKQWGNAWGKHQRSSALRNDEIEALELSLRSSSELDLDLVKDFIQGLRSRR